MLSPRWIKDAYRGTDVDWVKTQSQIYKMLAEVGIYQTRCTNMQDRFSIEFIADVREEQKPRVVRIVVPLRFALLCQ